MPDIILATLNARYIHSSLGLRYLYANLGDLQPQAQIKEYVIDRRAIDIVEDLLSHNPTIVGFGVYIWNIAQTTEVVALLKTIRPQLRVIIGGPEVSFEHAQQAIVQSADYVICGQADLQFANLCRQLLHHDVPALEKIIYANTPALAQLTLPYAHYSDEDIAHRVIYVEASRGCPFKCEFCLSALDKTAWPFDIELFLTAMQALYDRGARHFKFVDRTFNLKIDTSIRILRFFLDRMDDSLFLHFELIPDHLPEKLKHIIQQFPPGTLQFEIGIQTFNTQVQSLISRKQDNQKCHDNIHWLRTQTHAHLHTDLIAGLPGEDLHSFAEGFNRLIAMNPHEIQVGILKRLRGTPIIRHSESFAIHYNPHPPYNVLQTADMDFNTLQRINRFARYWDIVANSGRFTHTLPVLLGNNAFERFMTFSDWLYETTRQTHQIALPRLFNLLLDALTHVFTEDPVTVTQTLNADFQRSGLKGLPQSLRRSVSPVNPPRNASDRRGAASRQARHLP